MLSLISLTNEERASKLEVNSYEGSIIAPDEVISGLGSPCSTLGFTGSDYG